MILSITKFQLSELLKNYDQIKNLFRNNDFSESAQQIVQEYGNFKIIEYKTDEFSKIVKSYITVSTPGDNAPKDINFEVKLKNFKDELDKKQNIVKVNKKLFIHKSVVKE